MSRRCQCLYGSEFRPTAYRGTICFSLSLWLCAFLQDLEKEAEIRETDEVPMEEILQLKREADSQLSEEAKRAKNVLLGDDGFY